MKTFILFVLMYFNSIIVSYQQENKILKVEYDFYLNFGSSSQYYKSVLLINNNESYFKWGKVIKFEEKGDFEMSFNLNSKDSLGSFSYSNFTKDSIFSRVPWLIIRILLLQKSDRE